MIDFQTIDSLLAKIDRLTSPKFDVLELLNHPGQLCVLMTGTEKIDLETFVVTEEETAYADRLANNALHWAASYRYKDYETCLTCGVRLGEDEGSLFCFYHADREPALDNFDEYAYDQVAEGQEVTVDGIVSVTHPERHYVASMARLK